MDRTERFQKIDQLLNNSRTVSRDKFLKELEISLATFKRDIEYMRDRLGAPIIWSRENRGYAYEGQHDESFHLPGLWFNTSELHALLTMDALLENLQHGLIAPHIKPLQSRFKALMEQSGLNIEQVGHRIKILTVAAKSYQTEYFQIINQALFDRKRLLIKHFNKSKNTFTERVISPQRLVFYRDNWYLDSWCHQREALRSFSVDSIESVEANKTRAIEIQNEVLEAQLSSSYGIFSGGAEHKAFLKFSSDRARWVSKEQWHPNQESYYDEDGSFILMIPYSISTELIMDILKYGSDVEVLAPDSLRQKIKQQISLMTRAYSDSP